MPSSDGTAAESWLILPVFVTVPTLVVLSALKKVTVALAIASSSLRFASRFLFVELKKFVVESMPETSVTVESALENLICGLSVS